MFFKNHDALQRLLLILYYNYEIQVLDRGEKIELLVDKTENLRSQVLTFSFMMCCTCFFIFEVTVV